ncbi:MAG: NAD(+) synthase, partial [Clostridia bacterium]|nr:NAD(+) synthase [Clostridia bacterium]
FKLSDELVMGVEIGTDLYSPVPPSSFYTLSGANLIINPFGMCETVSAKDYRKSLVYGQSAKGICAYALSCAGVHESTTDAVYSGDCIIAENGEVIKRGERFLREGRIVSSCIDVSKLSALRITDTVFCDTASLCEKEFKIIDAKLGEFNLKHFNRFIDAHPFIPSDKSLRRERCEEIFSIQSAALAKRLEHTGLKRCVIGISGGLDSTLALLVAVRAAKLLGFTNDSIIGITMPGFGTTDRTYSNALELMRSLGVEIREISIKDACMTHFNDIGHDASVHDITYENTQARERTQILMDIANKEGGILVGTGDLSELAMGWCTFGGDHMSMYGVNASVPKTLVKYLVGYVAEDMGGKTGEILKDILDTPVSPELLPPDKAGNIAQKTEDNIGPYELHDFFLYNFFRFGFRKEKLDFLAKQAFMGQYADDVIEKWLNVFLKRFFISQFKRSCSPDAPKVGSVALSPRGDLRMPSDADFSEWVK